MALERPFSRIRPYRSTSTEHQKSSSEARGRSVLVSLPSTHAIRIRIDATTSKIECDRDDGGVVSGKIYAAVPRGRCKRS